MEFVNDNWTIHIKWSKKSFVTILAIFFLLYTKSSTAQQIYDLHQCKQLLLSQNYDIQIAKEESGSTTAIRKSVYTQFLPQFSFTGSYMRTDKKFNLLSDDMFAPVVPYLAVDPPVNHIMMLTEIRYFVITLIFQKKNLKWAPKTSIY